MSQDQQTGTDALAAPSRPEGTGRDGGRAARKHEAIARAALRLFLQDGYARTSMDAIAREAGVSKRTVYDYYHDKENLFLSVIRDTYTALLSASIRIIDAHLADVSDTEQALTAFTREIALTVTNVPERAAMVRLIMTEAPHFPELRDQHLRPLSMSHALAGRLAALASAGLLDIDDPQEAAGHLLALTLGQINNRSIFGAIALTEAQIDRFITSGVRVFLRAYRPAAPR
jgi:AcrR family transcriptional regulator